MMTKTPVLPGFVILAFVLTVGCGGGGKGPRNEKVLIEKAKSDFLSGMTGSFDFATSILEMCEELETPSTKQLGNLKVTEGEMFDYVKLPMDERCWAVELRFMGIDTVTKEEKLGVAILQYGDFIVGGVMQEGELMFVHTGITGQETKDIRKVTEASFDAIRKARKMK